MASGHERPHIQVPVARFRTIEQYVGYGGGGASKPAPPTDGRPVHGARLTASLEGAVEQSRQRRQSIGIDVTGAQPGVYLEFESFPGWALAIESLQKSRAKDPNRHIEVVSVHRRRCPPLREGEKPTFVERAAVFVPEGEVGHFLTQLERYALTTPKAARERRHENVYDRIAELRLATLRALWTDDESAYPESDDTFMWWEVWLRRTDGAELERLHEFAERADIRLGRRRLAFEDRIVTLAFASARQLASSIDVLGDMAELQRARELASFFREQTNEEQAKWVVDLAERTRYSGHNAPAVCIFDTGVNAGHPLLEAALPLDDCHSVEPGWNVDDHHGHGTQMAGLALFGDLVPVLESGEVVTLDHRLESVKILPPRGSNEPDLWGAITADATTHPEIAAPGRTRVFSMAITDDESRDRGQPTSWSSAVDALSAGRSFDSTTKGLVYFDDERLHRRLFTISAGNVPGLLEQNHLDFSDTHPVQDPAQAWNALTVGAFTDKVTIEDPEWDGWSPLASRGELSPWSSTGMTFARAWPVKPDIVMEGGNVAVSEDGEVSFPCDDVCLLTTYHRPAESLLETSAMTSAATAQAARLCARIAAVYPSMWPEMIRGLVVHSARWTPAMVKHFDETLSKTRRGQLLCRYGYGVPRLERALTSASNAVTLLVQDTIRPFDDGKMREIHLHALPWPSDVLAALGAADVRVRITLSYFVEPNPGRRGWRRKHRYQSHGLRFDVKGATESVERFRKRLNKQALAEEEHRPTYDGNDNWFLGPRARNRGSIHSDILHASAAEIAERGHIAVYPVTGWWKEQKKRDRSEFGARYALLVSIETDAVDADIYTPVATQVGVRVGVDQG